FVAHFSDLGAASTRPGSLEAPSHKLELAWSRARGDARPVHLNAASYKPLEPGAATAELERALAVRVDQLLAELPRLHSSELSTSESSELLARSLRASRRPLFVLGLLSPEQRAKVEELLAGEASARGMSAEELAVW